MQPISADVIEHADDFIFHLSENQLKEWLEELKRKQPYISVAVKFNTNRCKSKESIDFINRIQLSLIQCFIGYGISFPVISQKEIDKSTAWYNAKTKEIKESGDLDTRVKMIGEIIGQEKLVIYVVSKISYMKDHLVLKNGIQFGNIIGNCIVLVELYSQKVKKLLPPQSK